MQNRPANPPQQPTDKPMSILQLFVQMWKKFVAFAQAFRRNVKYLKDVAVACTILGVLGLLGLLVFAVVFISHPRVCLINRTSAFDAYTDDFYRDTEDSVFTVHDMLCNDAVEVLFHVGKRDAKVLSCDDPLSKCSPDHKNTPDMEALRGGKGALFSEACVLYEPLTNMKKATDILTSRGREKFREDLELYASFYSTLRNLEMNNIQEFMEAYPQDWPDGVKPQFKSAVNAYFARKDVLNASRFDSGGNIDWGEIMKFRAQFFVPIHNLAIAARKISSVTSQWCALYHQSWYTTDIASFLMQVYLLDLSINGYHQQRTRSYATRRALTFGLQFNIWSLYYAPYVKYAFEVRVPMMWMSFPKLYVGAVKGFVKTWGKVGEYISTMPCHAAAMALDWDDEQLNRCLGKKPPGNEEAISASDETDNPTHQSRAQRARLQDARGYFREGFVDGQGQRQRKPRKVDAERNTTTHGGKYDEDEDEDEDDDEDDEVIETFGFLKGLLAVGDFFKIIINVAKGMKSLVELFKRDPFRAIFAPILLIVGIIMAAWFMLNYALLTVLAVHFIFAGWYSFWYILIFLIVATILEVVFAAVLALFYVVLWLMDLATGGLIVKMMRCENLPNEWEFRRNYAEDNTYNRVFGTACCYPCSSRFRPVYGVLCSRVPDYLPDLCPQQQIITAYRTGKVDDSSGPFMFDKYPDNARFRMMKRSKKVEVIKKAFQEGKRFMGKCVDRLEKYDFVNRHICFNVDRLPDDKYSEETKTKMRALCFQTYCDYKLYRDSPGSSRYTVGLRSQKEKDSSCLCHGMSREDVKVNVKVAQRSTRKIITLSLLMMIALLAGLVGVYTTLTTLDTFMRVKYEDSKMAFEYKFDHMLDRE